MPNNKQKRKNEIAQPYDSTLKKPRVDNKNPPNNNYSKPSNQPPATLQEKKSTSASPPSTPLKTIKITPEQKRKLILIGDATARFTKGLLAYGAENNWEDVKNSEGRSWLMGDYRRTWTYVSKKDRLEPVDPKESAALSQHQFFQHNPNYEAKSSKKNNHIARKAATAILAHSGSCDEHAYVSAFLLMKFLPLGSKINICSFQDKITKKDFKHTFIVIGDIRACHSANASNDLILVDAWPIQGGACAMNETNIFKSLHKTHTLQTDYTFIADGKDHLIKRVIKQQKILASLMNDEVIVFKSRATNLHHDLKDQNTVHQKKLTMPLAGYKEDQDMWQEPSIAPNYQDDPHTVDVMVKLLESFPELKITLQLIDEELENSKTPIRKGSGFPS